METVSPENACPGSRFVGDGYDLVLGDCLEEMAKMEPDSVDLVFASPPYGTARSYDINFNLRGAAYIDWCTERFMECCRVSRGLVAWVIQGRTKDFEWDCAPALLMTELRKAGAHFRNPCIYAKNGIPGSGGPDWFRSDYEWIICGSWRRGKLPWSDVTACGHEPKWQPGGKMTHRRRDGSRLSWEEKAVRGARVHTKTMKNARERQSYLPPKIANPGNIIRCEVGGGRIGSSTAHENEAPFPEKLAERFVLSFCPPGGTVLDCFSGSGTTGAVALRHGRKYIGIDIRSSQIRLTSRRLQEVLNERRA